MPKQEKLTETRDVNVSNNKGESEPKRQKGAESTSNKKKGKHEKDDSSGAEKNTTKKGSNSV